jgi:hypothetical protein
VSGWSINRDGTAEFASASIRGNVVIVGNTTSGNIEIASAGGYATIKFYNIAHTDFSQIAAQDIAGTPQLVMLGGLRSSLIGPANPNVRSVIKQDTASFSTYIGASANVSGTPVIGGQLNVYDNGVSLAYVDSNNASVDTFTVSGNIAYQHDIGTGNFGGFLYETNPIPTVDYFTQTGWGAFNAVAFQNGWSNLGGNWTQAQYMMDCEGRVELRGVILGGTKTDGTVIFTLPIPFRPAKDEILPIAMVSPGAGPNVNVRVFSATGQVQIFGMAASTTGNFSLGGTSFSVRP